MCDFAKGDMLVDFAEVYATPLFSDYVKDMVKKEEEKGATFSHSFCGMYVQLRYSWNHVVNFDEKGRHVVKEK